MTDILSLSDDDDDDDDYVKDDDHNNGDDVKDDAGWDHDSKLVSIWNLGCVYDSQGWWGVG